MKTFHEWLEDAHPECLVDEGIIDSLGRSKFVRNAVTAAGLGAAALGGYGLRGMQGSKGGVDPLGNRAVASQKADSMGEGERETLAHMEKMSPIERTEFVVKHYNGKTPDYMLRHFGPKGFYQGRFGEGEREVTQHLKDMSPQERQDFVRTQYNGKTPDYMANYFGSNLSRQAPSSGWFSN